MVLPDQKQKDIVLLMRTKDSVEWSLPKILLSPGMSSEMSAIRLLRDQIGISVKIVTSLGAIDNGDVEKTHYYLCRSSISSMTAKLAKNFNWFPVGQVQQYGLISEIEQTILAEAAMFWYTADDTKMGKHKL